MDGPHFSLQGLPYGTVIEVVKRMDTAAFLEALRTSKWLYKTIQRNRHKFIKDVRNEDFNLSYQHAKDMDVAALEDYFLGDRSHFCYHMITIRSFRDNLRRVLSVFKNARIYADIVHVDTSTVVPEIFDYFKPKNYCFNPCRKKLSVATAVFPSGPFELINGRAVNPAAFEDTLLCLAGKSKRFHLTALNITLSVEPLKRFMAVLCQLRSDQKLSLSTTRPLPLAGFDSPEEGFQKFAFNTRGTEGKLLTLIVYHHQGDRTAGYYYVDTRHGRIEFACLYAPSLLEFERVILGDLTVAMSSALRLVVFLCLADLCAAHYECQYSSYYGGLFCRYRPIVYYSTAGVGLLLLGICCCFCYLCASEAAIHGPNDPIYGVHRCQNCGTHCCAEQPNSVVVRSTTRSYATPQTTTISGRTGTTFSGRE